MVKNRLGTIPASEQVSVFDPVACRTQFSDRAVAGDHMKISLKPGVKRLRRSSSCMPVKDRFLLQAVQIVARDVRTSSCFDSQVRPLLLPRPIIHRFASITFSSRLRQALIITRLYLLCLWRINEDSSVLYETEQNSKACHSVTIRNYIYVHVARQLIAV